jgi:hypothetical protein
MIRKDQRFKVVARWEARNTKKLLLLSPVEANKLYDYRAKVKLTTVEIFRNNKQVQNINE